MEEAQLAIRWPIIATLGGCCAAVASGVICAVFPRSAPPSRIEEFVTAEAAPAWCGEVQTYRGATVTIGGMLDATDFAIMPLIAGESIKLDPSWVPPNPPEELAQPALNGGQEAGKPLASEYAYGWPFRCLEYTRWEKRERGRNAPRTVIRQGGWFVANRATNSRPWEELVVPYGVAWVGLLSNCVVFAMLIGTPWALRDARRVLRRSRGLCASCGYNLRGLPETTTKCPECGTAIAPRTPSL